MSKRKAGLGRGLEALLRDVNLSTSLSSNSQTQEDSNRLKEELRYIPIEFLERGPYQPRGAIAEENLKELAESIQSQGVIQPILVSKVDHQRYEIIAGERRWRAAALAGLHEVPVIVRHLEPKASMAVALIENIQREDLNPLETATGLQRLLTECDLTHEECAEILGKSRSTITNLLRLLDLTEPVKEFLSQGFIEMGHARSLLSLSESQQLKIAHRIMKENLSVRQTEKLVNHSAKTNKPVFSKPSRLDPNLLDLQESLSEQLGTAVQIKPKNKGQGELIIQYFSLDELQGIIEKIMEEETV